MCATLIHLSYICVYLYVNLPLFIYIHIINEFAVKKKIIRAYPHFVYVFFSSILIVIKPLTWIKIEIIRWVAVANFQKKYENKLTDFEYIAFIKFIKFSYFVFYRYKIKLKNKTFWIFYWITLLFYPYTSAFHLPINIRLK